jgi:hypothetical protein
MPAVCWSKLFILWNLELILYIKPSKAMAILSVCHSRLNAELACALFVSPFAITILAYRIWYLFYSPVEFFFLRAEVRQGKHVVANQTVLLWCCVKAKKIRTTVIHCVLLTCCCRTNMRFFLLSACQPDHHCSIPSRFFHWISSFFDDTFFWQGYPTSFIYGPPSPTQKYLANQTHRYII